MLTTVCWIQIRKGKQTNYTKREVILPLENSTKIVHDTGLAGMPIYLPVNAQAQDLHFLHTTKY